MNFQSQEGIADFAIAVPVGPGYRTWLKSTLSSLAVQTCRVSVAICAVEDTADLRAVLAQFKDIISYVRIGPDEGQSAAINEGWTALNAVHYGWLNDDDILHPSALTRVLTAFETTQADVIHGRSDILENSTLRIGYGNVAVAARLLRENPIAQPSTFVKRVALAKICDGPELKPLDINNHYAMDWDLWQRLYMSGAKFACVQDPLSITRWNTQTKTARPSLSKYRDYFRILNRGGGSKVKILWTLLNFFIHNQATYGAYKSPFRNVEAILRRQDKSSGETPKSVQGLHVFHYQDTPMQVSAEDGEHILAPHLEARKILHTTEMRVNLLPIVRSSSD